MTHRALTVLLVLACTFALATRANANGNTILVDPVSELVALTGVQIVDGGAPAGTLTWRNATIGPLTSVGVVALPFVTESTQYEVPVEIGLRVGSDGAIEFVVVHNGYNDLFVEGTGDPVSYAHFSETLKGVLENAGAVQLAPPSIPGIGVPPVGIATEALSLTERYELDLRLDVETIDTASSASARYTLEARASIRLMEPGEAVRPVSSRLYLISPSGDFLINDNTSGAEPPIEFGSLEALRAYASGTWAFRLQPFTGDLEAFEFDLDLTTPGVEPANAFIPMLEDGDRLMEAYDVLVDGIDEPAHENGSIITRIVGSDGGLVTEALPAADQVWRPRIETLEESRSVTLSLKLDIDDEAARPLDATGVTRLTDNTPELLLHVAEASESRFERLLRFSQRVPTMCRADFNDDGVVDIVDFGVFGTAFNTVDGDPAFDGRADINGDGSVDILDFGFFGMEWGIADCE